ncbi:MAG: HAD family phosphatase [Bacillota bacterium]|nr:HAD family phosphatase [Bacillota bacterium]
MLNQLGIELIIFDMDGLMFDTEKISFISWRDAAAKYNYTINNEIFIKTIGANLARTKEIYLSDFGDSFPFEKVFTERIRIAEKIIQLEGVPVKKGLYELLDYLKQSNIKRAVATSTSRSRALSLLRTAGVDKFFDYILCGDEIEKSKPDPEIFLKTAHKFGCPAERCLVLEDSEAGIMAAASAGMLPVMIPDMKEPTDLIEAMTFRRMDSLLDAKYFLEELFSTSTTA